MPDYNAPTPEEALELVRLGRESVDYYLEMETHPSLVEPIKFVCLRLLDTLDEIEALAPLVGSDDLLANHKALYYVSIAMTTGEVLMTLDSLNEVFLIFTG